jgi:hypothetical protein
MRSLVQAVTDFLCTRWRSEVQHLASKIISSYTTRPLLTQLHQSATNVYNRQVASLRTLNLWLTTAIEAVTPRTLTYVQALKSITRATCHTTWAAHMEIYWLKHRVLKFRSVFCFVQYILRSQKHSLLNTRSDFLYTGLEYELTSRKWLQNLTLLVHSLCCIPCNFSPYQSKTFRLDHVHLLQSDCQLFLQPQIMPHTERHAPSGYFQTTDCVFGLTELQCLQYRAKSHPRTWAFMWSAHYCCSILTKHGIWQICLNCSPHLHPHPPNKKIKKPSSRSQVAPYRRRGRDKNSLFAVVLWIRLKNWTETSRKIHHFIVGHYSGLSLWLKLSHRSRSQTSGNTWWVQ